MRPFRLGFLPAQVLLSLFAWTCVPTLAACQASGGGKPSSVSQRKAAPVPAVAPNKTPVALFDSLGEVRNSANPDAIPWVRSIVVIVFEERASQAERQAAVDAIGGRVVGGLRWLGDDGDYYVQIRGTTFDAIMGALSTLRKLSQIDFAHPFFKDSTSISANRKKAERDSPR
jgi:hypothetical protein